MELSSDLVSQFAKLVNGDKKDQTETTVYGTTVEHNGRMFVQIDGSELLTPVTTTTDMKADERVTVMLKNHTATVTGNLSSPAARTDDVQDIGNKVDQFEIVIADKVDTKQLAAEVARIDSLTADNVLIHDTLKATNAEIVDLKAKNVAIDGKLTANEAEINRLDAEKIEADYVEAELAKLDELYATNAKFNNLESAYGTFRELTTTTLKAVNADISNLETNKLSTADAEIQYANIDFANINEAAVEKLFSDSGIIKDLVVSEGHITGELVGVTIKGDLIEAGTVKADKLVVKGSDGLFYKLNVDAMGETTTEQIPTDSLHGSVIAANTITAEKINVDDLVAFGATIGGFKMDNNAIHSVVKNSPTNTTRGIYLDNDGQFAVGDSTNYLRYFLDTDGTYKLQISAGSIRIKAGSKTLEEELDDLKESSDNANNRLNDLSIGGRNLLYNWARSGNNSYTNDHKAITVGTSVGNAYFYLKSYHNLSTEDTFTLSCDASNVPEGCSWSFGVGTRFGSFQLTINKNGRCYGSGKFATAINANTEFHIESSSANPDPAPNIVLTNFKLEKGNTPTDWTPAIEETNASINNAQNSADAAQSTANNANNRLDNIQIGGRNLIRAASIVVNECNFEETLLDENGNAIIQTTTKCSTTEDIYIRDITSWAGSALTFSDEYPPGEYTLNVDGANAKRVICSVQLPGYAANTTYSNYGCGYYLDPEFPYTFTLPSAAKLGIVVRQIDGATTCNLKNLKLEVGNKPTDWTPAPEDVSTDTNNSVSELNARLAARLDVVDGNIATLSNKLENLVVDETGASMMTQEGDSFVFKMGDYVKNIEAAQAAIDALNNSSDLTDSEIETLKGQLQTFLDLNSYVKLNTSGEKPVVELGNDGSFKVRITNTSIDFLNEETAMAYVTNESLKIQKAEVEDELVFGGFAWKERENGNMGLVWKG